MSNTISYTELDQAIFTILATPHGKIVREGFEEQIRLNSYTQGASTDHMLFLEGRKSALRQIIDTYYIQLEGNQ